MGNNDGAANEKPEHEVCLDTFYMAESELTEAQFKLITGRSSKDTGCPTCPAVKIAPDDAIDLLRDIKTLTGIDYRLPTEAEWEYAARNLGGQIDLSSPVAFAWYQSNSSNSLHPVKSLAANKLGLYDILGNVAEIVADYYLSTYYSDSPKDNPTGPASGTTYITRGGYFSSTAESLSPTKRVITGNLYRPDFNGVRLVRDY